MYLLKNSRFKSFSLIFFLVLSMLISGCSANQEQYIVSGENQSQDESSISSGDSAEGSAQAVPGQSVSPNKYKVLRVVDGDTIIVDFSGKSEKIRMIGIDTPESVHPDESRNTPEGKIASEFTRSRLEGQNVQLEFDLEERDKYGRLLAYVWLNDVMFNKTLLTEGYAKIATFPPNVKYVDDFKALEKQARDLKKGFWGEGASAPGSGSSTSSAGQPSAPAQAVYAYIGNSNSMKFHDADCEWGKKIIPENRFVFSSRQEAINAGYVPCKSCKP